MPDLQPVAVDLGEAGRIEGQCDSRFEAVLEAFVANFRERGESGASLCVMQGSAAVVDLWGGWADHEARTPWRSDTVGIVHSCTKGATALAAHWLVEQGRLDLDAPVAEVWPGYARAGKEATTARMMLDHSAGVPAFRAKVPRDGLLDWDDTIARLEAEGPFWQPGTRHGYHGLTFGWTVGGLVRAIDGRSLGTLFQEEIARPLGIDFWIGLPPEIEPRVMRIIPRLWRDDDPMTPFRHAVQTDRDSIPALFLTNTGGYTQGRSHTPEGRRAEVPAANGITNGRGLAGLYAPIANGGLAAGRRWFSEDAIARMGACSSASHDDLTLRLPTRFGLGFMLSMDNRRRTATGESVILGTRAFGHVGAGGSLGFADPDEGLSFGYMMSRMGEGLLLNARGQGLVDATYRALGYRSDASGCWRR